MVHASFLNQSSLFRAFIGFIIIFRRSSERNRADVVPWWSRCRLSQSHWQHRFCYL